MKLWTIMAGTAAATLALLGPTLSAQQTAPKPQTTEATPVHRMAKPALWKVADKDTTIYLFGTIHVLPEGINWYHGKLATAFEKSGELVTELPDIPEGDILTATMRHASLPPGQSLRDQFTPEQRTKYETAMKTLGLPVASFDGYKPWFAGMTFAVLPLMKAGFSLDNGVEAQLGKRNKALGRPQIGLETMDFQLGLFSGLPNDAQTQFLFEVIDGMPQAEVEVRKMVDAWAKGDAEMLAASLNAQTMGPALYETLLTNRNRNWAAWIDKRLDKPGVVFIAVGAGHLGGKDSVQAFLAKGMIKSARVQ